MNQIMLISLTAALSSKLFRVVSVRDFQTNFVVFIESVTLEGGHSDSGLESVFEVNEAEEVLAVVVGSLRNETYALESGERTENI